MAGISRDELAHRAAEALYTAVGLGILGVQHLQVQRRELGRALGDARVQLDQQVAALDGRLDDFAGQLDARLGEVLGPPVPDVARSAAQQALAAAHSARRAALATARAALAERPDRD